MAVQSEEISPNVAKSDKLTLKKSYFHLRDFFKKNGVHVVTLNNRHKKAGDMKDSHSKLAEIM